MKYNQPLDQPTNPNAPYVDGNPVAGIEGSIVPATSIEFDQREVVEVINAANVRNYSDFTNTPCAAPSNTDLTQLRKAIEGFIRTVPIPTWYIDTHVVWTVHGPGAMYPNLNAALEALSLYIITHNGQVTLQIAAGRWDYGTSVVTFDHPNADRIIVAGANLISDPVYADFAVTGYGSVNRNSDRTHALGQMRLRYTTELDFEGTTGPSGITIQCTGMTIKNLLLVGDRNPNTYLLSVIQGQIWMDRIACCNSGANGLSISSGGHVTMVSGSLLSCTGSVGHGIGIAGDGHMWTGSYATLYLTSNDLSGIGAGFDCGANGYAAVIANGNGGSGMSCTVNGQFQVGDNCQFNTNGTEGVFVDQGTFTAGNGCQFWYNGAYGLYVTVHSSAQAGPTSSFGSNGSGAVICGSHSYAYLPGCPGVAGSCIPPVNTLSGDGSIVTN